MKMLKMNTRIDAGRAVYLLWMKFNILNETFALEQHTIAFESIHNNYLSFCVELKRTFTETFKLHKQVYRGN